MARRCSNLEFKELEQALGLDPTSPPTKKSKDEEPKDHGWETYQCTLVTPLYGGGVEAGKIDLQMPIRASEIRGHLRFWWRVLYGNFSSQEASKKTFEKECAIWGGIGKEGATKSKVGIRVLNIKCRNPEPAFKYVDNHKKPGELKPLPEPTTYSQPYVLFPAQGKLQKDKKKEEIYPHNIIPPNLAFDLEINLSRLGDLPKQQVHKALHWWASFGGVGARTRRGLGAVHIPSLTPVEIKEEDEAIQTKIKIKIVDLGRTEMENWRKACERLRDFRQKASVGRDERSSGSSSPAGESRWPEPDSIRNILDEYASYREPDDRDKNLFPRAAFGLPIIFHFKPDDKGDPTDQTLEPANNGDKKLERMASPLIIRPYWNGETWQAAALLLPNWQDALDQKLKLRGSDQEKTPTHWNADPAQQKQFIADNDSPMHGRNTFDPLTAFLDYFEKGK